MARVLPSMKDPPPGRRFGRIIYLDCSIWESKRAMQRKLAEELKLDRRTMAMFEEQDEEDDFYEVDRASRDMIRNVAAVIDQTLRGSRFMVIFINGSDDEIILSPFGISEYHDHVVIWTFTSSTYAEKIRHTKTRLYSKWSLSVLASPQLSALLHEEAAALTCQRDIDPAMAAIDCLFYMSFLDHGCSITYPSIWKGHDPSSIWICDGVIQGDRAREISKALLLTEIDDRYLQADRIIFYLSKMTRTPYLIVKDAELIDAYEKRPYRWIAIKLKNNITSKDNNKVQEDLQTTLARASSIILGSEWPDKSPCAFLPNYLFKQCTNLCMLIISGCSFSFASPPFSQCHTLRYLGLDHCTDDGTSSQLEGEDHITKWACLYSLLVLDLYYTEWCEILSEEKIELMANLTELNIEEVWCLQWISHLEKRLPYLQRLRIIKPPVRQAQTSPTDIISNSLIDKTELEVLDLSGNIHMENLPTNLSKAIKLHKPILDGCVGLENVVVANLLSSHLVLTAPNM
ncbi:hypothetical protein C2845_PM13G00920 [Panicum miliaceum]|uniref:NB-ARC domain-containing protein n=1 Tax=Panicum miliaceum TaxID=4540 RepID=A0A3L6RFQ8_PANMI|nr:hypothetical protein C2845_PM13G00920 [Panicum miliaceum]